MKKELPKIYKGNVTSNNNLRVAHAKEEINTSPRETINKLFKENQIYKQNVEIETDSNILNTKVIGRTNEHIITIDNNVIKIDNIKKINILK